MANRKNNINKSRITLFSAFLFKNDQNCIDFDRLIHSIQTLAF